LLHAWMLELPEQAEHAEQTEFAMPGVPRRLLAPLPDNFRRRIGELVGEIAISRDPSPYTSRSSVWSGPQG
jgi:hypothetical protein